MDGVYGLLIAFSMYSKLPLPMVEWTKTRLKYVMCWFPAVGAACGGALWLWLWLAKRLGLDPAAAGLLGAGIPVLVTGGIHLDGFLDTLDARSSYGEREKKLEILKDPHAGAFAIIGACVYFLAYAGLLIQLYADGSRENLAAFFLVFPIERAFSGLSVASFPCAKTSGLAYAFADGAHRQSVRLSLFCWIGAGFLALFRLNGPLALLLLAAGGGFFGYYRRMCIKEFGGITGDLAGWFLQVFELGALAVITLYGRWAA